MVADQDILGETLTKYKRAWLITWEWIGDHARVENEIVAILDYRYPPKTIMKYMNLFYTTSMFALHEQLTYAKRRNFNPYPAKFGSIEVKAPQHLELPSQLPYGGSITCGSNPFLWGREIFDVEAFVDKDGKQHLKFKQRRHTIMEKGEIKSDWEECEIIRDGD